MSDEWFLVHKSERYPLESHAEAVKITHDLETARRGARIGFRMSFTPTGSDEEIKIDPFDAEVTGL